MSTTAPPLTIGRLAKAAGVNIETIRHYQRLGLIQEPTKPEQGFRHYPAEMIERLRFIKRTQQLFFSLKEVQQLLSLGDQHCEDVKALAQEKSACIQQKIEDLQGIQAALEGLISGCQRNKNPEQCAFFNSVLSGG